MKKAIFLLLIFISSNLFSQEKFYPPTVEISDNSLSRFLTELTLAVGRKDKEWILNHVNSRIKNNFGGNGGTEEFQQKWKLDDSNSRFWKITERLLLIGGSKYIEGSNSYSIPYVFTDWNKLDERYDPFEYSLITGTKVNLRNEPNITTSKIIGELEYDIVSFPENKSSETRDQHQEIEPNYLGGYSWYYVCTLNKELCGFVYWKYLTSPIGYRMGIEKIADKWKISFLIAGD